MLFYYIKCQVKMLGNRLTSHAKSNILVVQGGCNMDANITFRIDSDVKAEMSAICAQLGMTTSTAFNIFAKAFVRAKGMPFAVTVQEPMTTIPKEIMLNDADQLLSDFSTDYKRMAE